MQHLKIKVHSKTEKKSENTFTYLTMFFVQSIPLLFFDLWRRMNEKQNDKCEIDSGIKKRIWKWYEQ